VDAGHAAMLENRDRLRQQGIKTCGAGASLADAREPAVLERAGIRVAFLAYASVFPTGYEARSEVPGLVPLRAYDFWRPAIDNYQIPGMRPRVHSVTDERDLAGLEEDIRQAKKRADLVVTSFHWGDAMRPHHLTEHERRTAHFCIDRGADMVVGHHHHAVRGMEWYAGRPILYGLGHFVFDFRMAFSEEAKAALTETPENVAALGDDYGMYPREGWPLLPMHPDMRMTLFAYAKATKERFTEIGFVPCRLQPDGRVVAFNADSEEGRQVVRYVSRGIASQRLNARIESEGAPSIGGYRSVRCVDAGADVAASRVAR
jgi:hypothetical protein